MSYSRKIKNKVLSVKFADLLWVVAGAIANYAVVNPLANRLIDQIGEENLSRLGEYKGPVLSALKGGGAAYAAYAAGKLPKAVRLALLGVAGASGIEVGFQLVPAGNMVALNGTGDLFLNGVGATEVLDIPLNHGGALSGSDGDPALLGGGYDDHMEDGVSILGGTGELAGNEDWL